MSTWKARQHLRQEIKENQEDHNGTHLHHLLKQVKLKKKKMNWNFVWWWWVGLLCGVVWFLGWVCVVLLNTASHTTQITRVFTHEKWELVFTQNLNMNVCTGLICNFLKLEASEVFTQHINRGTSMPCRTQQQQGGPHCWCLQQCGLSQMHDAPERSRGFTLDDSNYVASWKKAKI